MYREYGVESDGELFKIQQEAIIKAREIHSKSNEIENENVKNEIIPRRYNTDAITKLFSALKSDDLLLITIMFLVINEGKDQDMILIVMLLYIMGIV